MNDAPMGLAIIFALYFLPTWIALLTRHHNRGAAMVINLFFGWTLIGWVIALAMVANRARPPA